ncbi:MAG: SET domain-containing protein-lysine N-methyltransferase [Candidatus Aenigmarchaeota archaeon]|nr:SET domain-containing protein-lysine N-methyltransferase [Candidatus Aenigmarchaeota archaeon]
MADLHKTWGHRWLTPKAKPAKSKIHGLGVIAVKPIRKGDIVSVHGGIIVPKSEINKYRKKCGHIGNQIDDNFFMCPANRDELKKGGVFNHSCNPNRGFIDSIITVAIREIKPGKEICADYAFFESHFEPFKCNCGSRNCRKIIRPDDWKMPAIRKKYGKYFSPYLKKKIKTMR